MTSSHISGVMGFAVIDEAMFHKFCVHVFDPIHSVIPQLDDSQELFVSGPDHMRIFVILDHCF